MSLDNSIQAANSEAQAPEVHGYGALWNTLISPQNAFDQISQRPNWILPFVLCVVVLIVFNIFSAPYKMEDIKNRLRNDASLSSSEVERRVQNINNQKAEGITFNRIGTAVLVFGILHAVKLFGIALFLRFGTLIFLKETTYKQILAICSYSFLILIPELLLKLALVLVKGTTSVPVGPAVLLPIGKSNSMLYSILENLDLFNIWMVILLIIGLSTVARLSKGRSSAIVLSFWGVWIVLSPVFSGLIQVT